MTYILLVLACFAVLLVEFMYSKITREGDQVPLLGHFIREFCLKEATIRKSDTRLKPTKI